MRPHFRLIPCFVVLTAVTTAIAVSGCKGKEEGNGAPPPTKVVQVPDMSLVTIDPSDVAKFPVVKTQTVERQTELSSTGAVYPDVSREVPVISLANGRVVDIKARLDENVRKGQLMFRVQSADISTAFDTYVKAVNDEEMARKADIRAQDLYKHGAISQAMVEQADDQENDAKADVAAALEQLKLYGVDPSHPSSVVNVYAPITGVVISQNVTNAAAAGVALSGSATAFTVADLTSVWILCDVYEDEIPQIRVGQEARIRVNGYAEQVVKGRIGDIGPVLDPQLRTAKVRIEVKNPGFMKLGMFVNATFTSQKKQTSAVVPADAVLHLHDRDWVFVPAGGNNFRRVEVRAGDMLSDNRQVILSGIEPGQQIVSNALLLETAGNK